MMVLSINCVLTVALGTLWQVNCLAWHQTEGNILASGSFDGTVIISDASKVQYSPSSLLCVMSS